MPELPDVEGTRRELEQHLVGRTVRRVDVLDPCVVHGVAPLKLAQALVGRRFMLHRRHGKWLTLPTDEPTLLVHNGMTGRTYVTDDGTGQPYDRLVVDVDQGQLSTSTRASCGTRTYVDGVEAVGRPSRMQPSVHGRPRDGEPRTAETEPRGQAGARRRLLSGQPLDQCGQAILREAVSLATLDGLEGPSIGNLANALEMSKSGVYAHFDRSSVDLGPDPSEVLADAPYPPINEVLDHVELHVWGYQWVRVRRGF